MKLTLKLLVLMALSISASAEDDEVTKKIHASINAGYEAVASAWYLNSTCNILSESELKKFKHFTGEFTANVAPFNTDKKMTSILKSAKATSQQEKFKDCGSEAKKHVIAGLELSQHYVKDLTTSKNDELRKSIAKKSSK